MAKNQTATKTNGTCTMASLPDPNGEVARLAYQFYSDRGCQHGHDQEDWLKAEAVIRQEKNVKVSS